MRTCIVSVFSAWLAASSIAMTACAQQTLASTQSSPGVASPVRQYVPGEVIVQFRAGATQERIHEIIIATGARIKKNLGALTYLLSFSNERSMDELVAGLRVYPEVLHAEPNWITRIEPPRPMPGTKPMPLGK